MGTWFSVPLAYRQKISRSNRIPQLAPTPSTLFKIQTITDNRTRPDMLKKWLSSFVTVCLQLPIKGFSNCLVSKITLSKFKIHVNHVHITFCEIVTIVGVNQAMISSPPCSSNFVLSVGFFPVHYYCQTGKWVSLAHSLSNIGLASSWTQCSHSCNQSTKSNGCLIELAKSRRESVFEERSSSVALLFFTVIKA